MGAVLPCWRHEARLRLQEQVCPGTQGGCANCQPRVLSHSQTRFSDLRAPSLTGSGVSVGVTYGGLLGVGSGVLGGVTYGGVSFANTRGGCMCGVGTAAGQHRVPG